MIHTLAISGYRSLRDLVLPLDRLTLVTGANGAGKSSLYRALRLLHDAALNSVVASLAHEGGLPSTLWAGPEIIGRAVKRGDYAVEPTARKKIISLKLGFAADPFSYSIDLGYPPPPSRPPPPRPSLFHLDPEIKRECIWHGDVYCPPAALVDRKHAVVTLPGESADDFTLLTKDLSPADSMLATIADPERAPEMLAVREFIRGWRFYDGFRTDIASPVRTPQIGTRTPVLNNDGTDLPAALETILEIGDAEALHRTIDDAFPGSSLGIDVQAGRFDIRLQQHGLLRPLAAAELSDGTLRFLLWTAALLTPRPPGLMVLNEPETSLHPDLLPPLARLIAAAGERTQVIVVSHAPPLIETLERVSSCRRLRLEKSFGETILSDDSTEDPRFRRPRWQWPTR